MKWLLFAVLLAVSQTSPPIPQKAPDDAARGTSDTTKQNKENKSEAPPASVHNKETPANTQGNSDIESPQDKQEHVVVDRLPGKDRLDKIYIGLTAVLVLIGIFTLVAIWYQAIQTRRSVNAMERSTGLMMSIEQGRILTYWDQSIHIDMSPDGVHDGNLSHYFNWACGNVGKTEARLNKVWARFVVLHSLADLPEKPDYSAPNEYVHQVEPLQPNSKRRQTEYFSVPLETDLPFQEMQDKHRKGESVLYAYGYARYTDVWGRLHEARFGVVRSVQYKVTLDAWVVAGPSEYNEST